MVSAWKVRCPGRRSLRRGLAAALLSVVAAAAFAQAPLLRFSIPAQPLAFGLLRLAQQAHISIAAPQELVEGKTGGAVEGEMDTRTALARILRPSGLTFAFVTAGAARILPARRLATLRRNRPRPHASPREVTRLTKVIVTAQRRQQPLQDVPISVSVVSGDAMAARNLHDIADISTQIPSVDFRPNTSEKDEAIFIRGIGTIATSQSPEPSVATVIDGVVMGRTGEALMDLQDVDQIEVLEGPQGTLFGKNASAGVIDIITKNPTSTPTGYLDAAYYQGNESRISGGVSGPITKGIAGWLSLFAASYDGNMENLYDHEKVNGYQHAGGRMKIIARPNERLKLAFGADFTYSFNNMPAGAFVSSSQVAYCPRYLIHPPTPNPCTPDVSVPNPYLAAALGSLGIRPSANNTAISNNSSNSVYDDTGGVSLQADWDVGDGYSLISISAWRNWRNDLPAYDYDQLSIYNAIVPQIQDSGRVDYQQISQELRVLSPKGGFLDYVGGLFFMRGVDRETYERAVTQFVSPEDPAQFGSGINHFGSSDDNYSAYGEANLNFTKRLRGIIGYREVGDSLTYHTDRVSSATAAHPVPGVLPDFADSGSETKAGWSGRTGLQYDVDPDVMTYATVSRGYKGPAYNVFFNMASGNTPPLSPETSNSYEVGVKSQSFGRRVQINVDGFITDFHNYQADSVQLVQGAIVDNLVNAGSVTTRGIETEIAARPIAGLTYRSNAMYDRAYIQNFPCPAGAPIICYVNGNPLPFAPLWKLQAEQDYRHPVSNALDLDVDSEYRWQSAVSYQFNETPDFVQPAYGIWDASLGLIDVPQGWSVRILVKNILNQHYWSFTGTGDLAGILRWVPRDNDRYLGVNFHKDFSL